MSENQSNVQTFVQQVDVDIDSWLGAPGAESVITPASQEVEDIKPNIFSSKKEDLTFLDKEDSKKTDEEVKEEAKEVFNELDKELLANPDEEDVEKPKSDRGRPRTDKSGLVEFLKKRIESNEMFAFDDYDEKNESLDDYLAKLGEKDIEELWKANIDNMKQEVASQTPQQFFESLPEELQYAAKYVADGGQDLKGLFKALAQTEEVKTLDPNSESDQEQIIRSYLQATQFGSTEEINEEIETWKDLGVLDKKAQKFKPKLDQMQNQLLQAKIQEQEQFKKQQEEAAEAYMQNVFETLRPGELNGVKLDKKTQALLYTGLVQPQYSSMNGRPTNLLGHLLEKYQFVDPNYSLIAEALWLLSDPDSYRSELKKQGKNAAVEQTVRQLKTEQARKNSSTHYEEEEQRPRKISRPQNIFKR
ncbi:MAG: hypothetical protein ACK518_01260 [bacterium]|jgi:hypothetical protein